MKFRALLSQKLHNRTRKARFRRQLRSHLLRFESLEERAMLSATSLHVNTFDDVVNLSDLGTISLREAIIRANQTAGDFEIHLQAGTYWLTIGGDGNDNAQAGDLDVRNNGKIKIFGEGAGSTIINAGGDAGENISALGDRVFHVHSGASLAVKDVTVTGGNSTGSSWNRNGGGFFVAGGTLALTGVNVAWNAADGGGGIFNDVSGNVIVTNSTLLQNSAISQGGGIFNRSQLIVEGSTLTENQAVGSVGRGGGIANTNRLVVTDSVISGNSAVQHGGGIYSLSAAGSDISTSEFVHNDAGSGGAIFHHADAGQGLNVHDSHFSMNSAQVGGAIRNSGGLITVTDSVFSENTASSGGAINNSSAFTSTDRRILITNSMLLDNLAIGQAGGAVFNSGVGSYVELTAASIAGNKQTGSSPTDSGAGGGAIANRGGGEVLIVDSMLNGNSAISNGGAIHNFHTSSTVSVANTTLSGNSARNGGAVHTNSASDTAANVLRIANSTLSGNFATELGGGVFAQFNVKVDLDNSTIVANQGSGLYLAGSNREVIVRNSILAGNGGTSDIEGSNTKGLSGLYNVIGVGNVGLNSIGLADGVNGNIVGVDWTTVVDTNLADNGGLTLTHALIPGSPAIDAGDPNFATQLPYDQRGFGFGRVHNGRIDIGAFESAERPAVLVTSVSLDGGNLLIEDRSPSDTDDVLTISVNVSGTHVLIHDPNNKLTADIGTAQLDANTVEVPLSNISGQIVVNTLHGDDILNIDFSLGNPIPAGGLAFHGGDGDNRLAVIGSGSEFVTYTPSAGTFGEGVLVIDGGTVAFTGLAPINFDYLANFTLDLPGGADVIQVAAGTLAGSSEASLVFSGTSGGVVFASAHVRNTTDVVIDTTAVDGNDTITLTGANDAHGNSNLTVLTGGGSDLVHVTGQLTLPSGGSLQISSATIHVAVGAAAETQGSGSIDFAASRNITLASGSSITTGDGDITLSANMHVTPTSGNFVGININAATIRSTGTGNLSLTGRGGDEGPGQYGVLIHMNGQVQPTATSGSGSVSVIGFGGAGSGNSNHGVAVMSARVSSGGGEVYVNGTGGGSGATSASNHGVFLASGGEITAGGTGAVDVLGFGGNTTGSGGSQNHGVLVQTSGSRIRSSGGNVAVTGTGGGAGTATNNIGVSVFSGAEITAGGTGSVMATGYGGNTQGTSGGNFGISVFGANALITSGGGDVSVIGTGGGGTSGDANVGVRVEFAGGISVGGGGNVNVQGTSGATGGSGDHGVSVNGAGSRIVGGNGGINISGTAMGPAAVGALGILLGSSGELLTTGMGDINITADRVHIASSTRIDAGANLVTLAPKTSGTLIGLGAADAAGRLGLLNAELDRITAGVLKIGSSDAGAITINSDINPAGINTLNLISGGSVSQSAPIQTPKLAISAAGAVTLNHLNNVDVLAIRSTAGNVLFRDADGFTVGSVDGVHGVSASAGGVSLRAVTGDLIVNNTSAAADVLAGSSSGSLSVMLDGPGAKLTLAQGSHISGGIVQFWSDRMDLGGTVEGRFGFNRLVQLQPSSAGRQIDLGSTGDSGNSLELSNAELNRITAGALQIGGGNSGPISISQAITPANADRLGLRSSGVVSQTAPLVVGLLAVEAGGSVSLEHADNDVNTLAIHAAAGDIAFADRNGFNVNTVYALQTVHGMSAPGGDIRLTAHAGHVNVLNTAAAADVNASGSIVVTLAGTDMSFSAIGTSHMQAGREVTVSADRINLSGTIAAADSVTMRPHSAGWFINLGSTIGASPNTQGFSAAGLALITTETLRIGSSDAGAITINSDINPAGINTLNLISGGSVSQSAPIQTPKLAISAAGAVTLNHLSNNVDVAAIHSNAGDVAFRDADGFFVGSVAGIQGVSATAGGVSLRASAGDIIVDNTSAAVDVLAGSSSGGLSIILDGPGAKLTLADGSHVSGGIVQLWSDRMDLRGTVEGRFGFDRLVQLRATSAGRQIDLGSTSDSGNSLELSGAELDRISARVLQIGAVTTGSIEVTQAVSPANVNTLHLISGGDISQGAAGSLAVSQLALEAVGSIVFNGYEAGQRFNQVTTLAGKATGAGSGFYFTNKGGIAIAHVAGIVGVSANGGGIAIIAHSPLTINAAVTESGGGNIRLVASDDGSGEDHLTINASVQTTGGTGSIELVAGDDLFIQGDESTVISAAAGTITATAGGGTTLDGNVQLITVDGPVRFNTADVVVHGTELDDTIRVLKGSNKGEIDVIVNGVSRGIFLPTSRIIVYGGDGHDDIEVDSSINVSAWLFGGNGNDRLKGGAGNNVLIGGDGHDLLIGGRGRNLLIGGNGTDRIIGGSGDDILIAGWTAYDHNLTALDHIMREWTRTDRTYQQRIANLRQGGEDGRNGEYRLVAANGSNAPEQWTVFDDEEDSRDMLTGTAGSDWFFCRQDEDKVTDLGRLEELDAIFSIGL